MSGFKVFNAGDILTAADVNGYLMEQSIPVFASTTDRDLAITAPTEGQFCYSTGDDCFFVYNGSWIAFDNTWKSWTPTWSGVTKGSSPTETYAYIRLGKFVIAHGSLTLSSTGSVGSVTGPVTVTMPVTSSTSSISTMAGNAFFFDNSASATFYGVVEITSNSTTATIRASNVAGTYLTQTALTSTIPFGAAWAGSDRIGFNVMYQVA